MVELKRKVAVFIDADNVSADAATKACEAIIKAGFTIQTLKAYGNFCHKGKPWREFSNRFAIGLNQLFSIHKGKNAADIALTVSATSALFEASWGFDAMMLISADADFVPLVTKAKEKGLEVIGVGASHAPNVYKAACTSWINLDSIEKEVANG